MRGLFASFHVVTPAVSLPQDTHSGQFLSLLNAPHVVDMRVNLFRSLCTIAVATTSATAALHAQRTDPMAGFDAYVARGVREWGIPGFSLAVVNGDSTVLLRGYGVRTIGRNDPVTARTLFANASTTKAFTAFAAALLVDEGKLRWDDPLSKYTPTLQLLDPLASREITIRDALSHRVGFGDPGYLWYGSTGTWDDIVGRLRLVSPASSFRSRYAYNNVTYAAAGMAAAAAAGTTWDQLVRRRILEPLGMNETFTGEKALAGRTDIASPHSKVNDTVIAIPRLDFDNIGPAGTMYSNATDMAKWLRFLLDSARVRRGAQPMLRPATFAEMFAPQTIIRREQFYPSARFTNPNFTAYGLGWFLHDYRGELVALHTGSIDGYVAIVALMPSRRVGLSVMANVDRAELRHALVYELFDRVLDAAGDARPSPRRDWSRILKTYYDSTEAAAVERAKAADARRVTGTSPSLPLDRYAGTYVDTLYGEVTIGLQNGALTYSRTPLQSGTLEHWNYDTFRIRWKERYLGTSLITFRLGTDGSVQGFELGNQRYRRRTER